MASVVFIIVVPCERKNEDSEIQQRGSDKSLKRSLTDTTKEEKTIDNDDDVVSLAEQINLPEVENKSTLL